MRQGALLVAMAAALAQVPPSQAPLLRGILLERDAQIEGGEFSVRGPGNEVVRYCFESNTHVERGDAATSVPQLRPGEEVEVASDPLPESPLRYARTVHAAGSKPPAHISAHPLTYLGALPLESRFPRGDLTFSGVVSYLSGGRLVLRTRDSGEQLILLRQDTRYLAGGDIVQGSDLKANMRVFVRAGKDLFGHTEAYQVMWVRFLEPHNP